MIFNDFSFQQASGYIDLSEYKNAEAWADRVIALIPNYEKVDVCPEFPPQGPCIHISYFRHIFVTFWPSQANGEGAAAFGGFYKSKAA
jgi:hypothetical protein